MTVYEKLFGTPEATAKTLDYVDQIDVCDWMADANNGAKPPERCRGCMYDYDRYGCERKNIKVLEWLQGELGVEVE